MNAPEEYNKKENAKRLREGLENHIHFVAEKVCDRHPPLTSVTVLDVLLEDREAVRFPVEIAFDALPPGEAVRLERANGAEESYRIIVHSRFEGREADLIMLVLSMLARVNYGKIVREREAILFGALLLDMKEEAYAAKVEGLRAETLQEINQGGI